MFKKKLSSVETVETNKKEMLVNLLKTKTPTLFDRDPVMTGNVNKLADDILELVS